MGVVTGGHEYVIKRLDDSPGGPNSVDITGSPGDRLEGANPIQLSIGDRRFVRLGSSGARRWVITDV